MAVDVPEKWMIYGQAVGTPVILNLGAGGARIKHVVTDIVGDMIDDGSGTLYNPQILVTCGPVVYARYLFINAVPGPTRDTIEMHDQIFEGLPGAALRVEFTACPVGALCHLQIMGYDK